MDIEKIEERLDESTKTFNALISEIYSSASNKEELKTVDDMIDKAFAVISENAESSLQLETERIKLENFIDEMT